MTFCDSPSSILSLSRSKFLSRKACNGSIAGQFEQQCIMHSLEVLSYTIKSSKSSASTSNFTAVTSSVAFWWMVQTLTEWDSDEPTNMHYLRRKIQNFEKPILTLGVGGLNSTKNSFKWHKTRHLCSCLFFPRLTKSFLPGIKLKSSSQ